TQLRSQPYQIGAPARPIPFDWHAWSQPLDVCPRRQTPGSCSRSDYAPPVPGIAGQYTQVLCACSTNQAPKSPLVRPRLPCSIGLEAPVLILHLASQSLVATKRAAFHTLAQ